MSNSWANLKLAVDDNPKVGMSISGATYNQPYELPTMSTTEKGGAKLGEGLEINDTEQLGIVDGAITSGKLASNAVTTQKIVDGAVTSAKLDGSAVTADKLADSAVTSAKVNDGAVTTGKIADGAVTLAKLDSSVVDAIEDSPTVGNGLQLASDTLSAKIGAGLQFDANNAIELASGDIDGAVSDWLDAHPEATTTVQDGSITDKKLADSPDDSSVVWDIAKIEFTEYDGYYNYMGEIITPSANNEKYTSKIYVSPGMKIKFYIEPTVETNLWVAYVTYDESDDFIERVTLISAYGKSYTNVVTIPNGVAAISFTYRTFPADNPTVRKIYNATGYFKYLTQIEQLNSDSKLYTNIPFTEYPGYILSADGEITPQTVNNEVYTSAIPCSYGDSFVFDIAFSESQQCWITCALYNGFGVFLERVNVDVSTTVQTAKFNVQIANSNAKFLRFTYRKYSSATAKISTKNIVGVPVNAITELTQQLNAYYASLNENVKSINHRGYNFVAPENTLPAFKLSKQKGFPIVETDIDFTSDNVPVLLHDNTINRTARNSDGTEIESQISINSITYAQALDYDFGIWKGAQYAGTKIPTFKQFVTLCKNIGLEAYVELKGGTETQIKSLVGIAEDCGMSDKITWISFTPTYLGYIKEEDLSARLGLLTNEINTSAIDSANALKTSTNNVFINQGINALTDAMIQTCKNADFPLEVWVTNTKSVITSMNEYISGVTSDTLIAGFELYKANID